MIPIDVNACYSKSMNYNIFKGFESNNVNRRQPGFVSKNREILAKNGIC